MTLASAYRLLDEGAGEIERLNARLAEAEALLREARERETRYVLPLYRDANYTARIDAFLSGAKP